MILIIIAIIIVSVVSDIEIIIVSLFSSHQGIASVTFSYGPNRKQQSLKFSCWIRKILIIITIIQCFCEPCSKLLMLYSLAALE